MITRRVTFRLYPSKSQEAKLFEARRLHAYDKGKYNPTETGTPQGGVISPLLANIGLHGLEEHIKSINPKLGFIKYADDFIVTAKDKESLLNPKKRKF
jgi:retron-type reverse transcriptase